VESLALKLNPRQKEAITFNRFLLLLHSNKLDLARELVPAFYETFPEHDMPVLLHASMLLQEKKANKAEELLTVSRV
jgi:signal recognition particle subunit SRP72